MGEMEMKKIGLIFMVVFGVIVFCGSVCFGEEKADELYKNIISKSERLEAIDGRSNFVRIRLFQLDVYLSNMKYLYLPEMREDAKCSQDLVFLSKEAIVLGNIQEKLEEINAKLDISVKNPLGEKLLKGLKLLVQDLNLEIDTLQFIYLKVS